MDYKVLRTDTADSLIRRMILFIAENFGNDVALKKLDKLEKLILLLSKNPYLGIKPKYNILRKQGYLVIISEKNLIFYKVDEVSKTIIIHAVVDYRQDYVKIIQGL